MERPDMRNCPEKVRSYIAFQDEQLALKEQRIENLTNMFLNLQKKQFGSKSEKNAVPNQVGEQLSLLFNEAEAAADPKAIDETEAETVKAHTRKRPKGRQEKLLENIPVQETVFEMPGDLPACSKCGEQLVRVGREYLRTGIEYIPAHVGATKYYRGVYACKSCNEDMTACEACEHADEQVCSACPQRPRTSFEYASVPEAVSHPVLKHSLASASSVANVLYSKYVLAVPLYRQVQDWKRAGLDVSRATLANWVVAVSRDWLAPMTDFLKKQMLTGTVIHCDETPVQVLHEENRQPTAKSYMWVYRSGEAEKHPIVIYNYQPSRSGDEPKRFLSGYAGYIVTDGYGGYNKVVSATRCGCWSHVRRKFVEASPGGSESTAGTAAEGIRFCDELFRIERELRERPSDKRLKARLAKSKKVLDAFWEWIQGLQALPGSALGRAVGYATGQKAALNRFLEDGRIPFSNNADENAIRPFVVGRKNWLFCNTPNGANASATVYSIVQTASLCGLDVFKYLCFLLQRLPVLGKGPLQKDLDSLAPWGPLAQGLCRGII